MSALIEAWRRFSTHPAVRPLNDLAAIRGRRVKRHVVLIDDIHIVQGRDGYPTVDELVGWIRDGDRAALVEVRDDILRRRPSATA